MFFREFFSAGKYIPITSLLNFIKKNLKISFFLNQNGFDILLPITTFHFKEGCSNMQTGYTNGKPECGLTRRS